MSTQRMTGGDWLTLAILSLLWGATFLFAKLALRDIQPLTLVAQRVVIAALVLLGVLALHGESLKAHLPRWRDFLLLGLLNNVVPFSLLFLGQRHLTAGLAAILNATTPIFTVLVLHVLSRDERLTLLKTVGVALGFAGVVVLVGPEALNGLSHHLGAELLCLGATLSYAFALLVGRRFRATPPLVTATGQLVASSVIMLPAALAIDQPWSRAAPSPTALAAALAMAMFSTALAYILYFRVLARAGATNAALVTFLIPASAIGLGASILGEALLPGHIVGLCLILAGLAVLDGRLLRKIAATARQG